MADLMGSDQILEQWRKHAEAGVRMMDAVVEATSHMREAQLVDSYFLGDYQGLGVSDGAFVPFFVVPAPGDDDKTDVLARPAR